MILITGATGLTGGEILRQLSAAGVKTRALVRNPDKAGAVRGPGVEIVKGDFDHPKSLKEAFKGVDSVYLVSPLDPRQVEREIGVIKAAKKAGVGRIVKLSVIGAGSPRPFSIAGSHRRIEEEIEKSGIVHTFLRPNFFLQNLIRSLPSTLERGAIYLPAGDARVSMVDVRDIAAVGVEALTGTGHDNKAYDITGPEDVTFGEVAEKITEVGGTRIKFVDVPPEDARKAMLHDGMPGWMADEYLDLFNAFKRGAAEMVTDTVRRVTGRKPRSLDEFLRDFKHLFEGVKETGKVKAA